MSLVSQGLTSCAVTLALFLQHHLAEGEWRQVGRLASLPIVHHPGYVCPLPPNHRFKMMKFHYLYEILLGDGVIRKEKQASRYLGPKIMSKTSNFTQVEYRL